MTTTTTTTPTRVGMTLADLTMHAVAADSTATVCGVTAQLAAVRDLGTTTAVAVSLNDLHLDGGRACLPCRVGASTSALAAQ